MTVLRVLESLAWSLLVHWMIKIKLKQVNSHVSVLLIMNTIVVSEILRTLSQENTMCFKDGSILLILRPLQVEGNDISEKFISWTSTKSTE